MEKCTQSIVVKTLCETCSIMFKENFRKQKVSYIKPYNQIIPYDVEIHGLRFTRFVEKPHRRLGKFNMIALFQPLSIEGWMAVLSTLLCMAAILRLTGFRNNPLYWFFVTLLEQGDDQIRERRNSNQVILLIWLVIVSLTLRNVYTSSLFTFITKDPVPPESVTEMTNEDILKDKAIQLFTHFSEQKVIFNIWGSRMRLSYNNSPVLLEMEQLKRINEHLSSSRNPSKTVLSLLNTANGMIPCDHEDIRRVDYGFVLIGNCLNREKVTLVLLSEFDVNSNPQGTTTIHKLLIFMTYICIGIYTQ